MDIKNIKAGKNLPSEVNVIIEIPAGGAPIKYEVDKDSGAVFVDRIVHTAMFYPFNYGFIPHTLSDDGDPVDVCLISPLPFQAGSVCPARPIGVLMMEDESGVDEKIICVPSDKIYPIYSDISNYDQLPKVTLDQIKHFFEHYKDLEKGKWVKVQDWQDKEQAEKIILKGFEAGK